MSAADLWIGAVRFAVPIPGASSLKDRRQVVRSLLERLKTRCGAAVSDLGPDGVWDRAELAAVVVGSSPSEVEERCARMAEAIERFGGSEGFEPLFVEWEVFAYGDLQDRSP